MIILSGRSLELMTGMQNCEPRKILKNVWLMSDHGWTGYNLKMNSAKTEFIYFGSKVQLSKCVVVHLNVNDEMVERAGFIKYLGAWLDAQLSYKEHTTKKCQTAIINFLCIRNICHLLTNSACKTLLLSLCISHLDYANALLYGLPVIAISKFQRNQNMCERLVLRRPKGFSITQYLKDLHWLPIHQRIEFKILTFTNKCLRSKHQSTYKICW